MAMQGSSNKHLVKYFIRRSAHLLLCALLTGAFLQGCAATSKSNSDSTPKQFAFWPQFPAEPRMQFLVSYRFSEDIEPPKSGLDELIYGKARQVLPINKPYGIEMSDGKIYVCDTQNAAVVVLDLRKQQTRVMGVSGGGQLTSPTDIAIAPDGKRYVTDRKRGLIFVYDADERYLTSFGYVGFQPAGIDVYDDELYVADLGLQQVQVLNRFTGEKLRSIGERGDQDGKFLKPLGVAIDNNGDIYVTDVFRSRVQKFSPDGRLLSTFGAVDDTLGSFVRPKHIAVDRDGIIYVVDASFQNVQMFDEQNRLLMFFGAAGAHKGSMFLPAGVCVNDSDLDLFRNYMHPDFITERLVLVTNQMGQNKVAVYALGQLRSGVSAQDLVPSLAPTSSGVSEEGAGSLEMPSTSEPPANTSDKGED